MLQGSLDAEQLTVRRVCVSQQAARALARRMTLSPDISWNRGLVSSLVDRAADCVETLVADQPVSDLVALIAASWSACSTGERKG